MRVFSLLAGVFFIGIGVIAIADADLWDASGWIAAAAAAVVGISGLVAAFRAGGNADDAQVRDR